MSTMRGPRTGSLVAAVTVALLAVAVGAHAIGGLTGGSMEAGEARFVEVVQTDSSGVIAGLVTETDEGPLGLTSESVPAASGWVVAHPEGTEVADEVEVVDEIPFEDPNGGVWAEREVRLGGDTTAWIVPLDRARHDPTLDAEYNFALVVDWDKVPEDLDITTTHVDELTLVE